MFKDNITKNNPPKEIPDMKYIIEKPPQGDRVSQFLDIFASLLEYSNYRTALEHYIRVSAKCSRCASSCHVYQTTKDLRDIPCYRSELLLSVYRRYFSYESSMFARLFGGFELTREQLQGATANTSGIPLVALKDSIEFLEEELKEMLDVDIKFPLDVENAEYIFFAPVSDFLMEADTLMGIAAVLHAAGVSWTIGTKYFDAINYGLFYSDLVLGRVLRKIQEETQRLKAKKVLIGECGHASRSATFLKTFWQGGDCPEIINIMELTNELLKEGRIKLDPNKVTERVTYHDPCNIARQGWIVEQPREIIKAFCKDFVEMTPNRTENYCCGGGGGTVSIDEIRKYRTLVSGAKKAGQIRRTGAHYVIAPCANCKKQIRETMEDNKVDGELVGLHDLILKAIIIEK